jgi:hypothetical protein
MLGAIVNGNQMPKALQKQIFDMPSLETASRIDDSDATNAACAADFRFSTCMRELEAQFELRAPGRGSSMTQIEMTTKPKTRKAPAANGAELDPIFAAIAEHKARVREYARCRNAFEAARDQAEKRHGKSLKGKALFIAAAEDTVLEYDQFCRAKRAERKAAMRMARVSPTTIVGAAAMIAHARREIMTGTVEDWDDWVPLALKTIAAALVRLTPSPT